MIRNAQIQVEHQSNRVMNADVLEASQGKEYAAATEGVWLLCRGTHNSLLIAIAGLHLQTNASIERVTQGYESKAMEVNARSRSINRERQVRQSCHSI